MVLFYSFVYLSRDERMNTQVVHVCFVMVRWKWKMFFCKLGNLIFRQNKFRRKNFSGINFGEKKISAEKHSARIFAEIFSRRNFSSLMYINVYFITNKNNVLITYRCPMNYLSAQPGAQLINEFFGCFFKLPGWEMLNPLRYVDFVYPSYGRCLS